MQASEVTLQQTPKEIQEIRKGFYGVMFSGGEGGVEGVGAVG